ncbi:josephin-like protein [Diospyros lotus]|uniref:josephin-like protein n=1 Tax=Diospyros lotus TaxID=55363 RepID=UPI00225583FF|nr:josephin-like protein [Diospyros lotus]
MDLLVMSFWLLRKLLVAKQQGCGRESFKPFTNEEAAASFHKQKPCRRVFGEKSRFRTGCRFRAAGRSSELSLTKCLRHLGGKVAAALHFICRKRRHPAAPNYASSASGRSNSSVAATDSHRAEAINDCIQFINSSSSLQKSNSLSTSSC